MNKLHVILVLSLSLLWTAFAIDDSIIIKGNINPTLTELDYNISDSIKPITFENDHHAINNCYKIKNGYLNIISSGEGLFNGYCLSLKAPKEVADTPFQTINKLIKNKAGLYIGISKKAVEKAFNQKLPNSGHHFEYDSKELINNIEFDVITTVDIMFHKNKLVYLCIVTSKTS